MPDEAVIQFQPCGWAELHGDAGMGALEACLKAADPQAERRLAYREGRWDGMVPLYEGTRFPAGLAYVVQKELLDRGLQVRVLGNLQNRKALDISRFTRDYLPGFSLFDHQFEGCLEMLTHPCGWLKIPTNGGKSNMIAAVGRYFWEERGWRTLVITSRRGLARQLARDLRAVYQNDVPVGQCGDGEKSVGVVTVGTPNTLIKFQEHFDGNRMLPGDPVCRQAVKGAKVLIVDESHHTGAETWYTIAMNCPADRRYAMSGTPLTNLSLPDMRMVGATGPCLYVKNQGELIAAGVSSRPKIAVVCADNASGPPLPWSLGYRWDPSTGAARPYRRYLPYARAYVRGVVENEHHNTAVVRAMLWNVAHGRQTLVVCRRKPHWLTLRRMIEQTGVPFRAVWGDTATHNRDEAKRLLSKRKIKVVLATTIFDEGEDCDSIESIVMAETVKKEVPAVQRVGRGLRRGADGKARECWVTVVVPTCHPKLIEHGLAWCEAWEREGFETRMVDRWPAMGDPFSPDDDTLLPYVTWDEAEQPMVAA